MLISIARTMHKISHYARRAMFEISKVLISRKEQSPSQRIFCAVTFMNVEFQEYSTHMRGNSNSLQMRQTSREFNFYNF